MAKKHLVIVESPAKAKTIGKYLGKDYEVKASMGHLRDLPKSKLGVDIEHDFEPVYQPIRGKEELISELKKAAKSSDTVYLATDPDREGEAISWHLKALLNLDDEKAKRVTFNEITKKVVSESIKEPRAIDQDLVDAQQARRVLDRIVGYQLSPLLWKKVRRGLSAGRVQSVAVRMVDDREKEIQAFEAQEYWTLDADLTDEATHKTFEAHYYGKDGKKVEPTSGEQVDSIIADIGDKPFTVTNIKRTDKQRSPSLPFTTSTLQQEASRKLNMTPRRTMAIAQQLYEGVDITGEGTVGLITYMRTDSLRISEEAIAAAKTFILGRYGQSYYPKTARHYKAKAGAQDAHEAIRPSNVNLTPEQIKGDLTGERRVRQCERTDHGRRTRVPREREQLEILRLHRRLRGIPRRRQQGGKGGHAAAARRGAGFDARSLHAAPALHSAARALHGRDAHPRDGAERHRPPVDLRADGLDDLRPRIRHQGRKIPASYAARRGGDGPDGRALPRHCGHEVHRPHGGKARYRRRGQDRVEGRHPRLLRRL